MFDWEKAATAGISSTQYELRIHRSPRPNTVTTLSLYQNNLQLYQGHPLRLGSQRWRGEEKDKDAMTDMTQVLATISLHCS